MACFTNEMALESPAQPLTRRSMLPLEAKLDGESVWSVPQSVGAPDQPRFPGDVTE